MPQETSSDGAAVRFPPPFVPLIALAVGEVLHRVVWPLAIPLPSIARAALALLLLASGIALLLSAAGLFRKTGQDPKPWLPSPEIISDGVYRYTRNPMYVSMGLLQAGLGVALADGWVVLLVPATWTVIYRIAVRHEEAYLQRKFGEAYLDYKRQVRRWL
jgi:protein-S-isoprenylcysteine O-methyltransferase Ste14